MDVPPLRYHANKLVGSGGVHEVIGLVSQIPDLALNLKLACAISRCQTLEPETADVSNIKPSVSPHVGKKHKENGHKKNPERAANKGRTPQEGAPGGPS